jgi:hypothetical protein
MVDISKTLANASAKEFSGKSMIDNENGEGMNITFYNAKSNCLPPINRQNI